MRKRLNRISGLGDVSSVLASAVQYAPTVAEIISDPYLPEAACRVDQIYQARSGVPLKVCNPTPATPMTIIGRAILPLKYVAFAEQNQWVYPATVVALLGLPFLVGYSLGRD